MRKTLRHRAGSDESLAGCESIAEIPPIEARDALCPSLGSVVRCAIPTVPPAPALLSITIVTPVVRDTDSDKDRAIKSLPLPGGNGTTIVMFLVGFQANAELLMIKDKTKTARFFIVTSPLVKNFINGYHHD
jgi:hypothetical protein